MPGKTRTAILAMLGLMASSAPSFAMSGLGCPDLPLYYRAVGTVINGGGACGLTMEQARAILAKENGPSDSVLPPAPATGKHHRS